VWSADLKAIPKKERRVGKVLEGGVDASQRRALARLGLATVSAYAAPTLLALRAAPRLPKAVSRVEFAA